ncbi:hypothetical protein V1477_011303 [Vespula maculifrons]|uniref:Transmembrane protein n=1 Tax=Vespula maculifrons TaxID=7453 RepID=A0ABD2C4E3_VESMC
MVGVERGKLILDKVVVRYRRCPRSRASGDEEEDEEDEEEEGRRRRKKRILARPLDSKELPRVVVFALVISYWIFVLVFSPTCSSFEAVKAPTSSRKSNSDGSRRSDRSFEIYMPYVNVTNEFSSSVVEQEEEKEKDVERNEFLVIGNYCSCLEELSLVTPQCSSTTKLDLVHQLNNSSRNASGRNGLVGWLVDIEKEHEKRGEGELEVVEEEWD